MMASLSCGFCSSSASCTFSPVCTSKTVATAWWSLPPLPRSCMATTELPGRFTKQWSMPPRMWPDCTWIKLFRNSFTKCDAELALKSPNKIMTSPGSLCS
eukprot:Skav225089  [mRNA]  locus=scaffold621:36829:44176:- [translate_table: standard]